MLVELSIAAITWRIAERIKNDKAYEIKNKWNNIMKYSRAEGIRNIDGETFKIEKIYKKNYGYLCKVSVPVGLKICNLEKAKDTLQDSIHCLIEINKQKFSQYLEVKIILNEIESFEYIPIAVMPNQLYLGKKADGKDYILNLNTNPHIIIAGQTGAGKSFLLASILTNIISRNEKNLELYLLQIAKSELDIFKECKNVRFSSNRLPEIQAMLQRIVGMINTRSQKFSSNGIKNITQWNMHSKKKMKRIIVCVEEISFFMEDPETFKYFKSIVKAGRSVGIHLIALTQRTTVANLGGDGELKSQTTVITARQRSVMDSNNAIDIPDAVDLREREFISYSNEGYVYFTAPEIDEDFAVLNKYVPEIRLPGKLVAESEAYEEYTKKAMKYEYDYSKMVEEGKAQIIDLTQRKKAKRVQKGKISLEVVKGDYNERQ